jgi:hypothetical protein
MFLNFSKKKITHKKLAVKKEILNMMCYGLTDTGFSSNIRYMSLKRKYHTFFTLSNNTKSLRLNLKLSKANFKKASDFGMLYGFYRGL